MRKTGSGQGMAPRTLPPLTDRQEQAAMAAPSQVETPTRRKRGRPAGKVDSVHYSLRIPTSIHARLQAVLERKFCGAVNTNTAINMALNDWIVTIEQENAHRT